MKWILKIMFIVDMILLASIRYVSSISFLNYPLNEKFYAYSNILCSPILKVAILVVLTFIIQFFLISFLQHKAKNDNDKSVREISDNIFFQNIEYQYIPSYLGISILAFSLSEQIQYLVILALFCIFLINTKIVFFSPWLKLIKNYRLFVLSNQNKEELLLLKGDNKEDNFEIKNLTQISTDVYIESNKKKVCVLKTKK